MWLEFTVVSVPREMARPLQDVQVCLFGRPGLSFSFRVPAFPSVKALYEEAGLGD